MLTVACAGTCFGQSLWRADGGADGAAATGWVAPEARELRRDRVEPARPVLEHRSIVLRLPSYLEAGGREDFLRETTMVDLPPGSIVLDYEGVEGYLVRRATSYYRRLWRDTLRDWSELRGLTPAQERGLNDQMFWAMSDLRYGRWWERTWHQSLTAERGGAPAQPWIEQVGEDLAWKAGPLEVTNTLKLRLNGLGILSLNPDPGRIYRDLQDDHQGPARDDALLERTLLDDDTPPTPEERAAARRDPRHLIPEVALDLVRPERRLLEGVNWRVRMRPRLRLRAPTDLDPSQVLRSASVACSLDVYLGQRRQHVASLEGEVVYDHSSGEVRFSLELALLTW